MRLTNRDGGRGDVGVIGIIGREEVRSAREGVGSGKEFSGDMDHLEVKVGEVNEPACLAAVECLRLAEIGEVLVVSKDLHREGGAMEIVAPGFQGTNDSEEFAVIDVIISFGGGEGLGEIGAGVPISVGISLEKDGAGRVFGGVGGDGEGSGEIREVKDGFCEEETFEGVE